jgi:hypothetical protein
LSIASTICLSSYLLLAVQRQLSSPGGIAPPGSPRTGREPLDSPGSYHSAVPFERLCYTLERKLRLRRVDPLGLLSEDVASQPLELDAGELVKLAVLVALVEASADNGATVFCKPWNAANGELFKKSEFKLNIRLRTITCPAGQTQKFRPGEFVEFDPATCSACPLRPRCTKASNDAGRTVRIAPDEQRQQRFRKLVGTTKGREVLRKRVAVEHRLAHLASKQGPRARYRGQRKNLFDLRRHAVVLNLEVIQRRSDLAKAA